MKNKKIAAIAVSAVLAAAIPTSAAAVGKWVELGKVEENTIKIGTFVGAREMELEETPARVTFKFQKNDKISDFSIVRKGDPDVTVMSSVSEATLNGDEYTFTVSKTESGYVAGATYSLVIVPAEGIHISGAGTSYDVTATEPTGTTAITVDNDNVVFDSGENVDVTAKAFWNDAPVTDPVTYSYAVKEGAATGIVTIGQQQNGKVTVTAADYGTTVLTVTADFYGETETADITVNVVDTHTVFVSENESITAGATDDSFVTELSTLSTAQTNSVALGDIKITDKSGAESADTLDWSIKSGGDNVKIESGNLIALNEGEAVLTATYHNREVELSVTAVRPEVNMNGTFTMERLDGTGTGTVVVAGATGTLESATVGTGSNLGVSLSGETLTYNREGLPTAHTALGKNLSFTLTTNEAVFKYKISVYTQVINDYTELKNFGTIAKAQYTDGVNSGGYFILGNDIVCDDETFVSTLPNDPSAGGGYNPYLFHGIFDGDGFNIDKLSPNQDGFIPCMGTSGQSKDSVIRNVSFTNATQLAKSGWNTTFLINSGNGVVENVYIHLKKFICSNNSENKAGLAKNAIIASGSDWSISMKNVIVEVDELVTRSGNFALISNSNSDVFNNVYAVGLKGNRLAWNAAANVKAGEYGSFDTIDELKAANVSEAFTDSFWTVKDGVPYPAKLAGTFDRTYKQNRIEVSEQIKTDTALHLDVSDVIEGEATVSKVTVGDTVYTSGITVESGVVSVADGLTLQMYGESNFAVEYAKDGANRIVSGKILLITQIINDFDELVNFGTVAKSVGSATDARGYFMLGNDIYCGGVSYVSTLPTDPQMSGEPKYNPYKFHGTFDGDGHNIDGFNSDGNGLIPLMGLDCYVKNVSFTNAQSAAGGLLASAGAGHFENVYVHVKSFNARATGDNGVITNGGSWETKLKNVFVEIDEIKNSPATFGLINATAAGAGMLHVYALGLGTYEVRTSTYASQAPGAAGTVYDKFDSAADMTAAKVTEKAGAFHSPFWTVKDGIPRPTNLPSFTESTKANEADVYDSQTKGFTLDVSDKLTDNDAEITSVIVAGQSFNSGLSVENGIVSVAGAINLQTYGDNLGYYVVYASGGKNHVITGSVNVYTQIINDFEELKNFGTVAKSLGSATNAKGYFVLGNDIDCKGAKYTSTLPNDTYATGKYYAYQSHVIFDGRGYNIDNFNPDANGLVPCAGTDAYIRNVSITNVVMSGGATVLLYAGQCNIENVYIHVKTYTRSASGNDVIAVRGGDWNTPLKNVVVVVDTISGTGSGKFNVVNAAATIQNVYTVNVGADVRGSGANSATENASCANYATVDAFKAANVASKFTDPFWTNVDGMPYPANLAKNN